MMFPAQQESPWQRELDHAPTQAIPAEPPQRWNAYEELDRLQETTPTPSDD